MTSTLTKVWAVVSLVGVAWMSYWLVLVTGYRDYGTEFNDLGQLVIREVRRDDAPVEQAVPFKVDGPPGISDARQGDLLLAVDGYPISQSDYVLHSNWAPSPNLALTLSRGGETFTLYYDKYPGTLSSIIIRWSPVVVATLVWILGALAVFVYRGRDLNHHIFASWCFAFALWMVGDRASSWSIPLSRTVTAVLGPLLAPAYIDLAFRLIGRRWSRPVQWVVRALYLGFGALSVAGLTLVVRASLAPETIFDLLIYLTVALPLAGLSLIVGPVIMGLGALKPTAYRRLLVWASGLTLLAVLPSFLLDIVPTLMGEFSRYRDIPMALYVVLPVTFGYLLFRSQNYHLDRLLSRTAILLLLGIVSVLVFAFVDILSGGGANENLLIALVTTLSVLVVVGILSERQQDAIDRILYGESRNLEQAIVDLAGNLPQINEQSDLVRMVSANIQGKLGVKRAELYLTNRLGVVTCFSEDTRTAAPTLPATDATPVLLKQTTPHALWDTHPWADTALTIAFRSVPVGVVLLGTRPQGEKYNLKEIQYLESVVRLLDLGFERIWLNKAQEEALILEIGSIARASLDIANDLHDGPVALLEAVLLHIDDLGSTTSDERVSRLNRTTKEAISQIRSIVDSVRPRILTESTKLLLQEAVDAYRRSAPRIHCDTAIEIDYRVRLSLPANDALYRIVRGALQNVTQHAQATRVRVAASCRDDKVFITIEDNGIGVAREQSLTRTELVKDGHFGIQFFYDYAASAGGACRVGQAREGGTLVEVVLPTLPNPAAASFAAAPATA